MSYGINTGSLEALKEWNAAAERLKISTYGGYIDYEIEFQDHLDLERVMYEVKHPTLSLKRDIVIYSILQNDRFIKTVRVESCGYEDLDKKKAVELSGIEGAVARR